MADKTTNLNLTKPNFDGSIELSELNENFDIIDTAVGKKVDKIEGKVLSTNDFTDAYKTKVDNAAQQSSVYSKTETDQRISAKVAEIVANAPEDFDTLKELSDWIENHEDSAASMNSAIAANTAAISSKVDKVTGKGLSSNDFTDADKQKLISTAEQSALNRSTLGYQRKNLLRNNCKSVTMNGVMATVNADGSVTLSGSNTAGKAFVLFGNICTGLENQFENNTKFLPNGQYIVSGGSSGCFIQITVSPDNTAATTSVLCRAAENDVLFNITDSHKYVWGRIVVDTGSDFSSPVTLHPMVRDANISDNSYEPYSKSSLDERVSSLEGSIEKLGGAASETAIIAQTLGYSKKNILKCDAEPKTLGGITFTVSNDLVNAAGTATGGFTYYYAQPAAPYYFDKDVIITYTGSISGCIAAVKTGEAGAYEYKNISANEYKIAKGTKIVQIYLQCSTAGTSVNITDFGVMIRDAEITDSAYEPYKPSVEERLAALEEKLAALEGGDT